VTGQLEQSLRAAATGATISIVGTTLAGEQGGVEPSRIQQTGVTIRGVFVGSAAMLRSVATELAESGRRPVIDAVFDFDDAPDAYTALAAAGHVGKIVVALR
jgi:NADPH:quinone reductase-like Zn-dependent oxidoreductase